MPRESRPRLHEIGVDRRRGGPRQRDVSVLAVPCPSRPAAAAPRVDVVRLRPHELADADPRRVEGLEDRAVRSPRSVRVSGASRILRTSSGVRIVRGSRLSPRGYSSARRGVVERVAAPVEEAEEALHRLHERSSGGRPSMTCRPSAARRGARPGRPRDPACARPRARSRGPGASEEEPDVPRGSPAPCRVRSAAQLVLEESEEPRGLTCQASTHCLAGFPGEVAKLRQVAFLVSEIAPPPAVLAALAKWRSSVTSGSRRRSSSSGREKAERPRSPAAHGRAAR